MLRVTAPHVLVCDHCGGGERVRIYPYATDPEAVVRLCPDCLHSPYQGEADVCRVHPWGCPSVLWLTGTTVCAEAA